MRERFGTTAPRHVQVTETLRGLVEAPQFEHAMRVAVLEDQLADLQAQLRELMTSIERHLAPTSADESHESCAFASAYLRQEHARIMAALKSIVAAHGDCHVEGCEECSAIERFLASPRPFTSCPSSRPPDLKSDVAREPTAAAQG